MATMEMRTTLVPLSSLPPSPPPPLVRAGKGDRQGASMCLVGLGLIPGLVMVGAVGIVGPLRGRNQPTMTATTTMLGGGFGGGN